MDQPDPGERPAPARPPAPDLLAPARGPVVAALLLGAPSLRLGNARGAYEVYACAARLVLAAAPGHELRATLDAADADPEPQARAGAMHAAFRGLAGAPGPAPAPDADPFELVRCTLSAAVSLGAPAYNSGDVRGCYEVYDCAARLVLAESRAERTAGALALLQRALDEAATLPDERDSAWALRAAFDEIRAMRRAAPAARVGRREMRALLSMAMQIGTPAFNLGDARGCYEVYACTARLLAAAVRGRPGAALRAALEEAAPLTDVAEQAWVLRRAFDALISTKH